MKAIETQYKGYRFRSRLEARWAVFFDALGLDWEYEPEGYDLGEAGWYLPDFFIEFNEGYKVWFEVKGKKATNKDLQKAQALADHTNIHCFISSGTMGVPEVVFDKKGWKIGQAKKIEGAKIFERTPETSWTVGDNCKVDKDQAKKHIESNICAFYEDPEGNLFIDHLYIKDTNESPKIDSMEKDHNGLPFAVIDTKSKGEPGGMSLVVKIKENFKTEMSLNFGSGRFYRSKNLIRAYKAARSARFEHGETPC